MELRYHVVGDFLSGDEALCRNEAGLCTNDMGLLWGEEKNDFFRLSITSRAANG